MPPRVLMAAESKLDEKAAAWFEKLPLTIEVNGTVHELLIEPRATRAGHTKKGPVETVTNYISKVPPNYFDWLDKELSQRRLKVKIKEGDIVAFKIALGKFGFARVLLDVFSEIKKGHIITPVLYWVHPRSLIIAPYAYISDSLQIDIETLINKKAMPSLCIFDLDVYRGEMPIVGHRPLSQKDRQILFPKEAATCITIPYTKSDMETFIATNGIEKN